MVNLETGTINFGDHELPIRTFEVWFRTPVGLAKTREFAVQRCKELDLDARIMIAPVVIAVTDDPGIYEEVSR